PPYQGGGIDIAIQHDSALTHNSKLLTATTYCKLSQYSILTSHISILTKVLPLAPSQGGGIDIAIQRDIALTHNSKLLTATTYRKLQYPHLNTHISILLKSPPPNPLPMRGDGYFNTT